MLTFMGEQNCWMDKGGEKGRKRKLERVEGTALTKAQSKELWVCLGKYEAFTEVQSVPALFGVLTKSVTWELAGRAEFGAPL